MCINPLLLVAQGKFAEAEPIFKQSLAIREKVLGPEHPDVATTLNHLGHLLTMEVTLYSDAYCIDPLGL